MRKQLVVTSLLVLALVQPCLALAAEPLVVMTWGGVWLKAFEELGAAYEKETGQPVKVIAQGTTDAALAKIKAQATAPDVDVWTTNVVNLERATEAGVLADITPALVPNIERVPASLRWKQGVSGWVSARGIFYRTDLVPFEIKRWEDLWDPRLKEKVGAPAANFDPGFFPLVASLISGGNEKNMEPGFERLKKLRPNIMTFYTSNVQSIRLLEAGEVGVVAWGILPNVYQLLGPDSKYRFVVPKPAFLLPQPMALVKNSPRLKEAAAFLNWVLGEEVQTRLATLIGAAPANARARVPEKFRGILPPLEEIHPVDWPTLNASFKAWSDRYTREVQTR